MSANNLLIRATDKQITLSKDPLWQKELLDKAPPVLWFGDNNSEPKILTLSANPSRSEYLDGYPKKGIVYLNTPNKNRFVDLYHNNKSLIDILNDVNLQNDIIDGYNGYFGNKPYNWFTKTNGAETLLNELDASYLSNNSSNSNYKYQALHIDLYPFVTLRDFNKIKSNGMINMNLEKWAKVFLIDLINFICPDKIIIHGLANYLHFCHLFSCNTYTTTSFLNNNAKCNLFILKNSNNIFSTNIKIAGLSVNLGNPRGFNTQDMKDLGKSIKSLI